MPGPPRSYAGTSINLDGMYSIYRLLSGMAYPSAHIVELYLTLDPETDLPVLRTTADYGQDRDFIVAYLHILCSSLVWAARALNLIDSQRANTSDRQRLRDAAKQLKIVESLAVTPTAKFRGEKAERLRARSR